MKAGEYSPAFFLAHGIKKSPGITGALFLNLSTFKKLTSLVS